MQILPKHKFDLVACEALARASDEEVISNLPELLKWLQDMNWPVASLVLRRVRNLGKVLLDPIREILVGDDGDWKYFIISDLISVMDFDVRVQLKGDLVRIVDFPSPDDIGSCVVEQAKEILDQIK